jgi:hypothetical protein
MGISFKTMFVMPQGFEIDEASASGKSVGGRSECSVLAQLAHSRCRCGSHGNVCEYHGNKNGNSH